MLSVQMQRELDLMSWKLNRDGRKRNIAEIFEHKQRNVNDERNGLKVHK